MRRKSPRDVIAIEATRSFRGRYHVLGGAINPIGGVGPEQLRIKELLNRLSDKQIEEIIIATDPNLEGEATATYLARMLGATGIPRVRRLASGLPVGGDLEYADEVTLGRAFEGRRSSPPRMSMSHGRLNMPTPGPHSPTRSDGHVQRRAREWTQCPHAHSSPPRMSMSHGTSEHVHPWPAALGMSRGDRPGVSAIRSQFNGAGSTAINWGEKLRRRAVWLPGPEPR